MRTSPGSRNSQGRLHPSSEAAPPTLESPFVLTNPPLFIIYPLGSTRLLSDLRQANQDEAQWSMLHAAQVAQVADLAACLASRTHAKDELARKHRAALDVRQVKQMRSYSPRSHSKAY